MIVINQIGCSDEFTQAYQAVHAGKSMRRSSWPEGMYLKKLSTGAIAVFRRGVLSSPSWQGASKDESEASDWVVF